MLTHVPMLHVQRELYAMPRGFDRFRQYLRLLIQAPDEVVAPLVAFNPMGKKCAADRLEEWIALDAETIASTAVAEAEGRLGFMEDPMRVGVVLVDDAAGGWTDRYLSEFTMRFGKSYELNHGWVSAVLWTSDEPTADRVRQSVLSSVYRAMYRLRLGRPGTLRNMMAQEGRTAAFAGDLGPVLDPDDLSYSSEIIGSYLDSTEYREQFPCLYGDRVARSVGHDAVGLSHLAGYAVAIAETRRRMSA